MFVNLPTAVTTDPIFYCKMNDSVKMYVRLGRPPTCPLSGQIVPTLTHSCCSFSLCEVFVSTLSRRHPRQAVDPCANVTMCDTHCLLDSSARKMNSLDAYCNWLMCVGQLVDTNVHWITLAMSPFGSQVMPSSPVIGNIGVISIDGRTWCSGVTRAHT